MSAQTRKIKKEKSHKLVKNIEETQSEEDKKALRESAKKHKTTRKGKAVMKILILEDSFTRMIRIIKEYGIYKGLNILLTHLFESQ